MKNLLTLLVLGASAFAADIPAEPLAKKGAALVTEHFDGPTLGPAWKEVIPTFILSDGTWKGSQTRADHGSVGAVGTPAPFQDVIIEFRFKLEGSTGFNAVCDDKNWKGTHAGHICRVMVGPKIIRLGDDKEGAMRNDIYEMRKDPARKPEADQMIKARASAFPTTVAEHEWHQLAIEIVGDQMRVVLDGKPAGYLKSPGLAHPTKTHFHWTVSGKDAFFDELQISAAAP